MQADLSSKLSQTHEKIQSKESTVKEMVAAAVQEKLRMAELMKNALLSWMLSLRS
mgnify:CR=1 FL=1